MSFRVVGNTEHCRIAIESQSLSSNFSSNEEMVRLAGTGCRVVCTCQVLILYWKQERRRHGSYGGHDPHAIVLTYK